MESIKIFFWWFMIGAMMTIAVIMIQGGLRDMMVGQEPLWEVEAVGIIITIIGGGILGGCVALILNRIRQR
jgi:hypothetical protein